MSAAKNVSVKRETVNLRIIIADPDVYRAFLTRLVQAPAPNTALRKTMQTPASWEEKNNTCS